MEPHWLQAAYDDFDAFAADAPGFDLEIKQLDRGPFASDMRVVLGAHVQVSWAAFARSLEVAGNLPLDTRTFVVATADKALWMWRGGAVRGSDLLIYPRDASIDIISRPGWSAFAVSVGVAHMEASLRREGLHGSVLDQRSRVPLQAGALDVLRHLLALVLRAPPGMDVARALDEEVPRTLARLLRGDAPSASARTDARGRLVQEARRFMQSAAHAAPSIAEVERALGTSGRTLRRAFREHMRLSPKDYLHAQRLNGVRHALRRGGPSVSNVARMFGFWHMGQLAADYKRLFGELPSETLRQAGQRAEP